ncbi:hypothetical protein VARIO8X_120065 [Burkholderiales bacterium 8X]|nr:hypothetical protein VARIO8X_120065 [Burkholderiales bacterium 8X]
MIEKAWQEVRSKMWGSLDADEKSELNKYYALFNKEYAQIDPKVEALDKDRADWYLQQIKLHFGEDHVTYVMLGFKHIYNLRARLMALKIPVVICSMIEMIDAYIPKGERAAWFDPEGIE